MFTQLEEDSEIASFRDDPIDTIEPFAITPNPIRDAKIQVIVFMQGVLQYLKDAKTDTERGLRLDIACIALRHVTVDGLGFNDLPKMHKVDRQIANHHVKAFQRNNHMDILDGQKKTEARATYHKTRKSQLQ